MTTFTREQLIEAAKTRMEANKYLLAHLSPESDLIHEVALNLELDEIALAAMQQEPVDFEAWWNGPRWPEPLVERALKDTAREAWNAAMLQGKAEPVSNRDELPSDEIECDICGHVSTDPEGRYYCCEDNSND